MNRSSATAIGSIAIFLWSVLALFTTRAGLVPPLLLLCLTFSVASVLFFIVYWLKGELRASWEQTPLFSMLFCGGAFFLYHFFYFYAFQHAPAVEAGLIAYLWPLLIVLLAGLTTGEKLQWPHLIGAVVAFIGTGIMLSDKTNGNAQLDGTLYDWTGYGAAFACAIIWSSYSVLNRRFQAVPSSAVLWYCLITALLAGATHLLLEETYLDVSMCSWFAILGLGLGPVGIAFFCWDWGVKRGNLSLLGVLSYTAPALSTAWLALFTEASLTGGQLLACVFITCGALFASLMPTKKTPHITNNKVEI
ncbi:aromatic amino acid exporter YddG [Marinomonas epiphytica]